MNNETLSGVYEYALRHMEAERNEIEVRIQFIRQQMGAEPAVPSPQEAPAILARTPRKFSAEAKARMKAGQARRWAARKKTAAVAKR